MRYFPLFILALVLSACVPPHHVLPQKKVAQLSVRGVATIKVVPDQVEMSLEAVTSALSAEEALAENSAAIEKLQQLLASEGLLPREYRTGQFSIQPQWSRPPRPAPANWQPSIVGYRVNNSLQIVTSKIDLAGRLLAVAQQAGVNRASGLRFSLVDPEIINRQAIAAATAKARQRAETLARAAGVKLGRLLVARVEEEGSQPRPMLMRAELASVRATAGSVPISAGEVKVMAAVVLGYAIDD